LQKIILTQLQIKFVLISKYLIILFRKEQEFTTTLRIGPFTVTKTEGNLQPGEIDTVTIECYPEFVGSQEENIIILVPDSVPEDRNGKLIKLSVNSCIPSVDLQDLDAIFHENYIVNRIEDFTCPKEVFNPFNELIVLTIQIKIKLRDYF